MKRSEHGEEREGHGMGMIMNGERMRIHRWQNGRRVQENSQVGLVTDLEAVARNVAQAFVTHEQQESSVTDSWEDADSSDAAMTPGGSRSGGEEEAVSKIYRERVVFYRQIGSGARW